MVLAGSTIPQGELLTVRTVRAQAWWYRKWVWRWIQANRLAQHADTPRPIIGFHIRGGDMEEADNEEVFPPHHATCMPSTQQAMHHRQPMRPVIWILLMMRKLLYSRLIFNELNISLTMLHMTHGKAGAPQCVVCCCMHVSPWQHVNV